ncbi:MAG: Tm-1-like ATP-binding domain-containing protein [Verrucomicrobiales bacterium]|nr:Tm-1-like ATP-binding domain-containing protein [Verrucomicrobiales bacterium]
MTEPKTIAVLGTLDSKGEEHGFVAKLIRQKGHIPLLIDVGTGAPPTITPDITRQEVAAAAGIDLDVMMARKDRGECVVAMSEAVPVFMARLAAEGKIQGIISLGGGGGTAIGSSAMRGLPVGFPKVMVSTLASGNTAHYVGSTDITMIPSIVDVSGLNRISNTIFTRAVGAICGMVEAEIETSSDERPLIAASMFGNTTECVDHAREILEEAGYEVLVFHATGTGGRTMEKLIEDGLITGVLDITTTEWADELVGATLSAGPTRLEAAGKAGVPAIVTPGCLDMANFGARETVPEHYEGRNFYIHNPQVTLMRTNPEECAKLGEILAQKVNAYTGPVKVLLPTKAISIISAEGQAFYDPAADEALFNAIKSNLSPEVELIEIDAEINDPEFSRACANALLELLRKFNSTSTTMPQVKHYGCFQFKEGTSESQISECFAAMGDMVGKIPGLLDFNYGPYDSAEGLNDGYTHGFIMTFESPQARDEYLPHPIHEAVKDIVVPHLDRIVVFDFNLPV